MKKDLLVGNPSSLFKQTLNMAISNATHNGRRTITARDVRDIAKYRLKYNQGLSPSTVAELRRMSTLRGVINASGKVFMRNGKLHPINGSEIIYRLSNMAPYLLNKIKIRLRV